MCAQRDLNCHHDMLQPNGGRGQPFKFLSVSKIHVRVQHLSLLISVVHWTQSWQVTHTAPMLCGQAA